MNPFQLFFIRKLIFINQIPLVPIGFNCSIADYLREKNIRKVAYPFDWVIVSFRDANRLIKSGFKDFMDEKNLVFNPTSFRQYFDENGTILEKKDQLITPVLCKKYNMLFPHDFGENAQEELFAVRAKYLSRIERLKETILKNSNSILVYNVDELNAWQKDQFKMADIGIPEIKHSAVDRDTRISNFKYLDFEELRILIETSNLLSFILKISKYRIGLRTKSFISKINRS